MGLGDQEDLQHDYHIGVYIGWGSDLEVLLGGNFGLEGPGFLSYPLNYELLLSFTYSEYSKHRYFLMPHSLWKFLHTWGYVKKIAFALFNAKLLRVGEVGCLNCYPLHFSSISLQLYPC